MTNDKMTQDTYRKLKYFFDNKIDVHFKDFQNIFYNGTIIDLDEKNASLVLNERVKGMLPILLEHINSMTIFKFEVRN
jgi:hypothetical protein